MKKKKIGKNLFNCCLLFGGLLTFTIGYIGFKTFEVGMYEKNSSYAKGIIDYVKKDIDVDEFAYAVKNKVRNQEIVTIEKICDNMKQTHDIEYLYIIRPLNFDAVDNMEYILTGESEVDRLDSKKAVAIGTLSGDEFTSDIVRHYASAMETKEMTDFVNNTEFGYVNTFMETVFDKEDNPIAIIACDLSMNDYIAHLKEYIMIIGILALIILTIFIFLFYLWLKRRVIKPISLIQQATHDFVDISHNKTDINELNYNKPDIKTNDELESLSNSVDTMAKDLKQFMVTYLKVAEEKNKIASELSVATNIQASMLPNIFPAFPNDEENFDIYATMNPAKEVGGDFYDFFKIDETHLAIVAADVSGKGVPAALFMVIGKTLIKDHTTHNMDVIKIFKEVNNILCESNSEGLFITAFEAVIDLTDGTVNYVNAGHETPFIYHKKDDYYKEYPIQASFVLAGMENIKYKGGTFKLEEGDAIFEYTDGVTEATNAKNELFGMQRLSESLNKHKKDSPKELLSNIKNDIDTFVGVAPQFDDITMLHFKLKKYMKK